MSDTYRTPDSPLGRALAQGRLAAAAQRAEREELDRANRAAVDELRATLAALDPPLAVEVAQERVSYTSLGADLQVWIVPEPGGSRYHLCALHTAARDLPVVMAYPSTAEAVDRLQAVRRREAQQIAALIASTPRPAEPSPPAPEQSQAEAPARSRPGVGWVLGGGALVGVATAGAVAASGAPAEVAIGLAAPATVVGILGGAIVSRPPAKPLARVEGPLLTWPAGGAVLLGLAALVEGVAAGTPAADVLFSAGASATLGLLLGAAVSLARA